MVLESWIRTLNVRRLLTLVALVALMTGMMGAAAVAQVPDWHCPADAPAPPWIRLRLGRNRPHL